MKKKPTFKNSILSYFESRKNGEDVPELKQEKLKAQPTKKIPVPITPNPHIDDSLGENGKQISDLGGSIDNLIKALNNISASSPILKKRITNNKVSTNNKMDIFNNKVSTNNKMDIFNNVYKKFNKNKINNSSKNIKNTKEISFPQVPAAIKPNRLDKTEKFIENLISSEVLREKIDRTSNELSHRIVRMNRPKRQYRATSANKRVPKMVDLTSMTENNKNVFNNLSNKMMTIVPSKTSSKIMSSLMNYYDSKPVNKRIENENSSKNIISSLMKHESSVNNSIENNTMSSRENNTISPQTMEKKIKTSISKINMNNIIGKDRVNILKVPSLAEGGIVDRPTLAMIGEGNRSEEIRPIDNSTRIEKSSSPSVHSIAQKTLNTNAALKLTETTNNNTFGGTENGSPILINSSNSASNKPPPPPAGASVQHAAPSSMAGLKSQTVLPRWRRNLG